MSDLTDDVSAYLDDELAPDERAAFRAALEQREELRVELDEVGEVRALVRDLDPPAMPDGFIDRLLAAGAADADAAVDLVAPPAPVVDLDAARTRRRGWTRFAAAAVGVAAAGAIVLAVALPGPDRSAPALATQVRVHQAATAASGDPVSGLAPLAGPVRFGR
jgi:anti-sigma factor RsiW